MVSCTTGRQKVMKLYKEENMKRAVTSVFERPAQCKWTTKNKKPLKTYTKIQYEKFIQIIATELVISSRVD